MRSGSTFWQVAVAIATVLSAACGSLGNDGARFEPPTMAEGAGEGTKLEPCADASSNAVPGDDASDAAAPTPAAPFCTSLPAQCALSCDAPTCSLVCNPADATDCRWDCPAPTCSCAPVPAASCQLHEPEAKCDVKCMQPSCTVYCPKCTTLPCAPCESVCEPAQCVTHCQAPKPPPAADGGWRVTHCQAPKPSCSVECDEPPACRWERAPACAGDEASCPPIVSYQAVCEPACHTSCEPLPPARCEVRGCDEACDPLTDCAQQCDKPDCSKDPDTGTVSCGEPTGCTQACGGGLCHVTSCF